MLDIASSVNLFAARSCSFNGVKKQIETLRFDKALPWAAMTRLRETGLQSQTRVATQEGWRPAETLLVGDMVLTFDHGAQPVRAIQTVEIDPKTLPDRKTHLMGVPAGVLGNRQDMQLLPMQEVVIELDEAEDRYGDPFVLIPAHMLEGYKGIHKAGFTTKITVVMLAFEREQILYSDGGMLAVSSTEACFSPIAATLSSTSEGYPRLTTAELRRLVQPEPKTLPPAFAESSIDETYAAIEARLA
ncbi:MAG: Hint domain-containing protein [Natronohydrobacter sp.]|nr:Hint domain-containing protein [Natronohydrobacter sp.]